MDNLYQLGLAMVKTALEDNAVFVEDALNLELDINAIREGLL